MKTNQPHPIRFNAAPTPDIGIFSPLPKGVFCLLLTIFMAFTPITSSVRACDDDDDWICWLLGICDGDNDGDECAPGDIVCMEKFEVNDSSWMSYTDLIGVGTETRGYELCTIFYYESGERSSISGNTRNVSHWSDISCAPFMPDPDPGDNNGGGTGPGGGGGGNQDSCCTGEDCPAGVNPFNVYDGNVTRRITDLRTAYTGGASPMQWTRFHNTRERGWARAFGQGGGWRHSWQYELIAKPVVRGRSREIALTFPSGFRRSFVQQPDGSWAASGRYPEKLKAITDGFEVTLREKSVAKFVRVQAEDAKGTYQLQSLASPAGRSTFFDYNALGQLTRVSDPDGRYLFINYSEIPVRMGKWERFHVIKKTPDAGQWLEIQVPAAFQENTYKHLRLIGRDGSALAVAEAQFFAPDSDHPLRGAASHGTGANPDAAFDGAADTAFAGDLLRENCVRLDLPTPQKIARVRILPVAGREDDLQGAAVAGFVPIDTMRSCLDSVSTSDGQNVRYEYDIQTNDLSLQAYPVLARVQYQDGVTARYGYTFLSASSLPYLEQADDPYYGERAKKVRYNYARLSDAQEYGTIFQEANPETGAAYATLEFDKDDPDLRHVHYTDMRTVTYRVPKAANGRLTEYIDSLGRKTTYEFENNGAGMLRAKVDPSGRRTEFTRDANGRPTRITRSDGYDIKFERDHEGRVSKITNSRGITKTKERDAQGRLTGVSRSGKGKTKEHKQTITRDARGRATHIVSPDGSSREFAWDSNNRVTAFRSRHGGLHKFAYDVRGLMDSHTAPDGGVTRYEYDHLGRRTRIANPDGSTTHVERNLRGLITRQSNLDGSERRYTYDDYGRKTAEIDEIGRVAQWQYDDLGRLLSETGFGGDTTTYDYTETPGGCGSCSLVSNPTRIVRPDGRIEEFLYDTEGRLLMKSDAVGTSDLAVTLYAYDDDNNLIQQTNPDGGIIRHTYDARNRRLSTIDPLGRATSWTYDEAGNRLTETDPTGRVTTFAYNDDGDLMSTTTPDGAVTTRTYDSARRLISLTNALGNTTRWNYNTAGDLLSYTDAAGAVTKYNYDAMHRRTSMTLPDGGKATWKYDFAGNVVHATTPDGLAITNLYDAMGRLLGTSTTHAKPGMPPATTTHTYDAAGRLLSTTDPLGRTMQWTYNARDQVTETIFPDDTKTRNEYDAIGRLLATINQIGHATRYTYTTLGNMATLTDANGNAYAFEYDNMRRKTAMIYPDNSKEQWAYDPSGRMITYSTRTGQGKTITYNADNRPLAETWSPAGCAPDVAYAYDTTTGRLLSADNGNTLLTYTYDKLGRLLSETTDIRALLPHMAPHTVGYFYDPLGRKAGLVYPDGMKVTYRYDAQGRMTEVYNGGKKPLAVYTYDSHGRRSKLTRDNGVVTNYTYDPASQILAIDHIGKNNKPLAYAHYEYDSMGRRTSMTREDNQIDRYRYDATSQLIGVDYGLLTPDSFTSESFTYDPLGNRMENTVTSPDGAPETTQYKTNNLNQYTEIASSILTPGSSIPSYDSNGNLTDDGKQRYRYDAQNRLIEVEAATMKAVFAYDPLSRCILRQYYTIGSTGDMMLDEGASVVMAYDTAWNTLSDRTLSGRQSAAYIHGNRTDEILANIQTAKKYYPHGDALGSVIALSVDDGKKESEVKYSLYGLPINAPNYHRFLYTGREWLATIGLNEHRYRYYIPNIGRWLTPDPIRFKGGLNMYLYVNNNTTKFVDRHGLAINITYNDLGLKPPKPNPDLPGYVIAGETSMAIAETRWSYRKGGDCCYYITDYNVTGRVDYWYSDVPSRTHEMVHVDMHYITLEINMRYLFESYYEGGFGAKTPECLSQLINLDLKHLYATNTADNRNFDYEDYQGEAAKQYALNKYFAALSEANNYYAQIESLRNSCSCHVK